MQSTLSKQRIQKTEFRIMRKARNDERVFKTTDL
jgi:hypothetical protein